MLRSYFMIDFIEHSQNQAVFRNIFHRIAVVLVADLSVFVDQHQGRDTTQLENVPFLPVQIGNLMPGVGQTKIRELIFGPMALVGLGSIRANADDLRVTRAEGRIIITQAFEMGAAMRSHESAQENQNNVLAAFVIREFYGAAFKIGQFKIGGEGKVVHIYFSGSVTQLSGCPIIRLNICSGNRARPA